MSYTVNGIINAEVTDMKVAIFFLAINLLIMLSLLATAMFALELLLPATTAYWIYLTPALHIRASLPTLLLSYIIGGFFRSTGDA